MLLKMGWVPGLLSSSSHYSTPHFIFVGTGLGKHSQGTVQPIIGIKQERLVSKITSDTWFMDVCILHRISHII